MFSDAVQLTRPTQLTLKHRLHLPHAEDLGGETWINLDKLRRDDRSENVQRLGGRRCRLRDILRSVERKPGIVGNLRLRVSGMHACQPEAPSRTLKREQAARLVTSAIGPPGRYTLSALVPGALTKSTCSTKVRRVCSSRNRITLGMT